MREIISVGKGGESDDLVRLLLNLFCGRLLLQLLFVSVWKLAVRETASPSFSRTRRRPCTRRTRPSRSRPGCRSCRCPGSGSCAGRPCGSWRESFTLQSTGDRGVPRVVWRYGLFADALFGVLGGINSAPGRDCGPCWWGNHLLFSGEGSDVRPAISRSRRFRDGRRARQVVRSHSRGWHWRTDLLSDGHTPCLWCAH